MNGVSFQPAVLVQVGSVNLDFGWEVMKDFFNIELLIANNFIQDDLGTSSHHELATGLTAAFQLTKKLEFFAE